MECSDAYTGEVLFSGQLALYDDNKRDSETTERRVLSLDPSVVIPARRVIAAAGTRFIVGRSSLDDFDGKVIRLGHVLHEATYLSRVRTIAEVCLDSPGFTAYAGRAWVKNASSNEQDSELTPQHHIHYSHTEALLEDQIVTFEGKLFVVRTFQYGPGGTLITLAEEMESTGREIGLLTSGVYNPVSDAISGTPASTAVLRMRWQSLFRYRSHLAPKFGPGDIQLAFAKSAATPVAGSTITLSDGTWKVQSALSEGAVWLCRAVRHG